MLLPCNEKTMINATRNTTEPVRSRVEDDFVPPRGATQTILSVEASVNGTLELYRVWLDGTAQSAPVATYTVTANVPQDRVELYRIPRCRVRFVPSGAAPYTIRVEINTGGG